MDLEIIEKERQKEEEENPKEESKEERGGEEREGEEREEGKREDVGDIASFMSVLPSVNLSVLKSICFFLEKIIDAHPGFF